MRLLTPQKPQTKKWLESLRRGDGRWGETKLGEDSPTGKPKIYINHNKFKRNPETGKDYEQEMLIGEGIHLIKDFLTRKERSAYIELQYLILAYCRG